MKQRLFCAERRTCCNFVGHYTNCRERKKKSLWQVICANDASTLVVLVTRITIIPPGAYTRTLTWTRNRTCLNTLAHCSEALQGLNIALISDSHTEADFFQPFFFASHKRCRRAARARNRREREKKTPEISGSVGKNDEKPRFPAGPGRTDGRGSGRTSGQSQHRATPSWAVWKMKMRISSFSASKNLCVWVCCVLGGHARIECTFAARMFHTTGERKSWPLPRNRPSELMSVVLGWVQRETGKAPVACLGKKLRRIKLCWKK